MVLSLGVRYNVKKESVQKGGESRQRGVWKETGAEHHVWTRGEVGAKVETQVDRPEKGIGAKGKRENRTRYNSQPAAPKMAPRFLPLKEFPALEGTKGEHIKSRRRQPASDVPGAPPNPLPTIEEGPHQERIGKKLLDDDFPPESRLARRTKKIARIYTSIHFRRQLSH